MITERGTFPVAKAPKDFIGLSTDSKPVDVPNASSFYEMDTGTYFFFDAENKVWHEMQ